MEHCEECGFVYEALAEGAVPGALRSLGTRFAMRLTSERPDPVLEQALPIRPRPEVWSALEYACHVRDVLLVQRERLFLALVEERPQLTQMHREERPRLARYLSESPAQVARELSVAADMLAWAFAGLDDAQWQRTLLYNVPAPSERTVLWLARHTVHEGEHHLRDVDAALRSASIAPGP